MQAHEDCMGPHEELLRSLHRAHCEIPHYYPAVFCTDWAFGNNSIQNIAMRIHIYFTQSYAMNTIYKGKQRKRNIIEYRNKSDCTKGKSRETY